MEKQTLPNSTLILVFGILSIVTCFCYGVIGIVLSIVAIILANKATALYKTAPENYLGYGNVKAGRVMAIIGLVLSLAIVAFYIWIISYFGWETLQNQELLQEKILEMQTQ